MLCDRDLTYLGKEIITPSALPLSGLEPKLSLHHKSWEEEEGGVTSPSCSREHKGDEGIGGKLWELPFLSLSEGIVGISNQPSNLLTPPACVHSPVQPGPVPTLPAQPSLGNGAPDLCKAPHSFPPCSSSSMSWHQPPLLCTSAFATRASVLPKYGSWSLLGQQSQMWLSLGLVYLLIFHWETEDLGEVCITYMLLERRQLPRNPDDVGIQMFSWLLSNKWKLGL